jgi:S-methylmethionine-dependent homocysteine/selenocysteine methylase
MGHIEEIEIALETVKNLNHKIWLSLIMRDKDHILSGHNINDVFKLASKNVDCLMLNCNSIAKTNETLELMQNNWGNNWGVYPNLGFSEPVPAAITIPNYVKDADFKKTIFKYLRMNPKIIGSCCGSSPIHIKMIKEITEQLF